jgi:hypothetical protein
LSATETQDEVEAGIVSEMLPDGEPVEVDTETGEILDPEPEEGEEEEGTDARAARTGDVEKASKQLENEAGRHARRVEEIMGPDFGALTTCELCWPIAPGFRWDKAPDDDQIARVRVAIGLPDVSNFAPSATERQCDDCRGLGKVRTGSTVPGQETASCDACKGKGYVGTRPRQNGSEAPVEALQVENGVTPAIDDGIERDMFGTPATDPDFGKMPNMRQRPVDYWATNRA